MPTPLKKWNILPRKYKFGVPTHYNNFHIGTDVSSETGTELIANLNGNAISYEGKQGGNTLELHAAGKVFRFLHLDELGKNGIVKRGEVIGKTGNTGLSTGPHLHHDISRGSLQLDDRDNFIDPDAYFAPKTIRVLFVANKTFWDYKKRLIEVKKLISEYTNGSVDISFTCKSIDKDPSSIISERSLSNGVSYVGNETFKPFLKDAKDCDIIIYYQDTKEAWPDTSYGGWSVGEVIEQEYPVRGKFGIALWGYEHAGRDKGEQMDYFTGNVLHELSHVLHVMSGKEDKTHYFDYEEKSLRAAYENIDFDMVLPRWDVFMTENEWIHGSGTFYQVCKNFVINFRKQYYRNPGVQEWGKFYRKIYE